MSKAGRKLATCPNCTHAFSEKANDYCPSCGQKNDGLRVTFGSLVMEFLGDVFTFDSKIFRSTFHLITKPGFITREFWEGKRARYIPPLRMFLILGVLFFAILNMRLAGDPNPLSHQELDRLIDGIAADEKIELLIGQDENNLGLNINYNKAASDSLNEILVNESSEAEVSDDSENGQILGQEELIRMIEMVKIDSLDSKSIVDSMKLEGTMVQMFAQQAVRTMRIGTNAALLSAYNNFSFVVIFMIPIMALLLKLLFYQQKEIYYLDHLIFSLHLHSFFYIFGSVFFFIGNVTWGPALFILGISIYTLLAIYRAYQKSYKGAIWRLLVLSPTYFIIALFFVTMNFVVSFLLL